MSTDDFTIVDFTGKTLTPQDIKQCIEELRKLVWGDSKLSKVRTDDNYLLRFLHCTNFNVTLAFKQLEEFYDMVEKHPDWFLTTSPLAKKHVIERNAKVMLGERDKDGRCLYLVKMGNVDAHNSSPQEQAQIDQMWFDSVLEDPKTRARGISVIMDMKGYSWKLFRWMTPSNLNICMKTVNFYPCKEFVYHVVNTSFWVNASIKMVWPILGQEVKKKVKFHYENWPSLHEYVSPDVLPPEYGGTGPDIDFNKLNEWLFERDPEIRKRLENQRGLG